MEFKNQLSEIFKRQQAHQAQEGVVAREEPEVTSDDQPEGEEELVEDEIDETGDGGVMSASNVGAQFAAMGAKGFLKKGKKGKTVPNKKGDPKKVSDWQKNYRKGEAPAKKPKGKAKAKAKAKSKGRKKEQLAIIGTLVPKYERLEARDLIAHAIDGGSIEEAIRLRERED